MTMRPNEDFELMIFSRMYVPIDPVAPNRRRFSLGFVLVIAEQRLAYDKTEMNGVVVWRLTLPLSELKAGDCRMPRFHPAGIIKWGKDGGDKIGA